MTSRHSAGSRDKNEAPITELLRRWNVRYWLMAEGAGFDILVFLSPMIALEIKNPDMPPSKRKLTDAEQECKEYCDAIGIPYYVVETPEEVVEILGKWIAGAK
jgi:hypothetical protein